MLIDGDNKTTFQNKRSNQEYSNNHKNHNL